MSFPRYRMLFGLCASASMVLPATAEPPSKPNDREVAQWIKELGADDFAVREKASRQLWLAGEVAEATLEKALQNRDPEVARRARAILDKFRWGIYPDTPATVVALIQSYKVRESDRVEIVQKLLRGGEAGLLAVLKFAQAEKDETQRNLLNYLVSSQLPTACLQAATEDKYDKLDRLLELGHNGNVIDHSQYVAYWLLRGKLDERIAHFRARLQQQPDDKRCAETLTYLYRAKGDLAEARKAAKKTGRDDLLEAILYEAADWKALAARPEATEKKNPIETWGYRAAYARLAGDTKGFENALSELHKQAETDESQRYFVAKAFFLNDRPDEGLSEWTRYNSLAVCDFLWARLKYREALEMVNRPSPAGSAEECVMAVLKAQALYRVGEKDKAKEIFAHLGEQIKDGADSTWVVALYETEHRLGLKDDAFDHYSRFLSVTIKGDKRKTEAWKVSAFTLKQLFAKREERAELCWEFLSHKFPDAPPALVLKRLRQLMEGKAVAKDVKAWIEEADLRLSPPNPPLPSKETARRRQAMAEAALAAGLNELAHKLLAKADTPQTLLHLGDLLAHETQWAKAAERYRQAWRKNAANADPTAGGDALDPLPLYLAGHALARAGQEKEGRKLMTQAHWALLSAASERLRFLDALAERGHEEAARRETEILWGVSEPNSFDSAAVLYRRANAAAARKDYARAAEGFEQWMLDCLHTNTSYKSNEAYFDAPAQVHQLRAAALVADGKIEAAQKQIELSLAALPGSVDLVILLVPEMERRSYKKEAAALFERCYGTYAQLCRDYPRCAHAHNAAAWMSACCRRNLDEALRHARKAIELSPENAGYFDTLAEIHFQRGDKDKAIAAEKHAIELDPKKPYYRKQLKRLEAGDSTAERPPEDGD